MAAERIKDHDGRLRELAAAGGFVADPFNRWWHRGSGDRVARMTTREAKWYATDRATLETYLGERRATYPTAQPIRPCAVCPPEEDASTRPAPSAAPRRRIRPLRAVVDSSVVVDRRSPGELRHGWGARLEERRGSRGAQVRRTARGDGP